MIQNIEEIVAKRIAKHTNDFNYYKILVDNLSEILDEYDDEERVYIDDHSDLNELDKEAMIAYHIRDIQYFKVKSDTMIDIHIHLMSVDVANEEYIQWMLYTDDEEQNERTLRQVNKKKLLG